MIDSSSSKAAHRVLPLVWFVVCAPGVQAQAQPPQETTLEVLLAHAEQHSPALGSVRAQQGYADAARAAGERWFPDNPSLQLGAGPRIESGEVDVDLSIGLSQQVELAGERGLRKAAAGRVQQRVHAQLSAARWALRSKVSAAYRDASMRRERLELAVQTAAFADDVLAVTKRRAAAGDLSVIDARVAESDWSQAKQALLMAEQQLTAARLQLCALTGWPLQQPPWPTSTVVDALPPPQLAALLDRAPQQHPDVVVWRASALEADAQVALADRERWPKPTLGIELGREGAPLPGASPSYIVLGTLELPLPLSAPLPVERGRARTEALVARAEQTASEHALRAGIAAAHAALQSSYERLQVVRATLSVPLDETLALVQRAFDAGEIPLLDVLLVRERLLRARGEALDAAADYARARIELESAVGVPLEQLTTTTTGGTR